MASMASVQELIKAENEARGVVESARSEKSQMIKNARREAEEEIQRFRAQKEAEHEKLLSMDAQSNASDGARLKDQTDQMLRQIESQLQHNQGKVVDMLLRSVLDV